MLSIEMVRTMLSYHEALYRKLWQSIMELTDEQFVQPIPYSHGSIRDQMVHVASVDERWLAGLKGDREARRITRQPEGYPDRNRVRDLWDQVAAKVRLYAEDLAPEELSFRPRGMRGPVWQILLHMVNHGTDHRAQILRMLDEFGAPTFDQDLIIHLWSRP